MPEESAKRGVKRCMTPEDNTDDGDGDGAFEDVALRPVRSTLVAPILPDPTLRRSGASVRRVKSTPNGIEPHR